MIGRHKNIQIILVVGVLLLTWTQCVDPISIDLPPPQDRVIIEGRISTDEGPYTVKVTRGFSINQVDPTGQGVESASVTLYDDQGTSERLTEVAPGIYETGGIMQGAIGRSYHIVVELEDGLVFESEPDELLATGMIDDIRFQYKSVIKETNFGVVNANVFEIYVDGQAGPQDEAYTRWNVIGTYEIQTSPELREIPAFPNPPIPDPAPCSGYRVISCGLFCIELEQTGPCDCCDCWVTEVEPIPQLSDNRLIQDGNYKNIKVTEVPITPITFHNKYRIEVEQMSMTRRTFEFFRLIKAQIEDSDSFFQPTFGEIIGNINPVNTSTPVTGIFWATDISRSSEFIFRADVPYPIVPIEVIRQDCRDAFPISTNVRPDGW